MLAIDATPAKKEFLPAPEERKADIHMLLPRLAKEANQSLVEEILHATGRLAVPPAEVDEFVTYIRFLHETSKKFESIEEEYEKVREIYLMMEEHEVMIEEEEIAAFSGSKPALDRLKQVIESGENSEHDDTVRMDGQLSRQVREHLELGKELSELSRDPLLSMKEGTENPVKACTYVDDVMSRTQAALELGSRYEQWQVDFGMTTATKYELLEDTAGELTMLQKLWHALKDLHESTEEWKTTMYKDADVDAMEMSIARVAKVAAQVSKSLPKNNAAPVLAERAEAWMSVMPVLLDMKNDALQDTHWEELEGITGHPLQHLIFEEGLTMADLFDMGLDSKVEKIQSVSVTATQERVLLGELKKVEDIWTVTEFLLLEHKPDTVKDVFILGGIDDVNIALEESQVKVSTILGSRYVSRLREQVEAWDKKLRRLGDTLEEWLACQRQWLYLENIFASPDITGKLPAEAKMFQVVDANWKELMKKAKHNPVAIGVGTRVGVLEMFQKSNEQLDIIQKHLEKYLEQKRLGFPRFYFLGDDDLIDILSQSKDAHAVQPHMMKMFDAIKSLKMDDQAEVHGMTSAEGEYVSFEKPFKARNEVERWLLKVEDQMRSTLYRDMKDAITD